MNTNSNHHLKEDQIINAAFGDSATDDRVAADLRHASECIACNEELRWLNRSLLNFRGTFHEYAAQQHALSPRWNWRMAAARQVAISSTRWALAVFALLLLSAVPLYRNHLERQRQLQAEQDQLLLQQIDEALDSPVPNAMQPLASLANWNPNPNQTQPSPGR
jgi:hypothetical protein